MKVDGACIFWEGCMPEVRLHLKPTYTRHAMRHRRIADTVDEKANDAAWKQRLEFCGLRNHVRDDALISVAMIWESADSPGVPDIVILAGFPRHHRRVRAARLPGIVQQRKPPSVGHDVVYWFQDYDI